MWVSGRRTCVDVATWHDLFARLCTCAEPYSGVMMSFLLRRSANLLGQVVQAHSAGVDGHRGVLPSTIVVSAFIGGNPGIIRNSFNEVALSGRRFVSPAIAMPFTACDVLVLDEELL